MAERKDMTRWCRCARVPEQVAQLDVYV